MLSYEWFLPYETTKTSALYHSSWSQRCMVILYTNKIIIIKKKKTASETDSLPNVRCILIWCMLKCDKNVC